MTSIQKRNDEMINILRPDFFARAEPNASLVHYQTAVMSTCALKGFFPMSVVHNVTPNIYVHDVAVDHDLLMTNTPTIGYLSTATVTALPPWINFVAANSQYLAAAADDSQHDILGTETYVSANERGLTIGGWFKFTTAPASIFGLISKWYSSPPGTNQAAYRLYKTAANTICFEVSPDGTAAAAVNATSTATVTTDIWYHLYGRFNPGVSVNVFVDTAITTTATATAAMFNSNEPLVIGRTNRANYLNGKCSMAQLNASQLSNSIVSLLYEQSRIMYSR